MDYVWSATIGIFSSLIASVVFLFFLRRIRPNIVISDKIARRQDTQGNNIYLIKIINKSRRPIINIEMRLQLMETINVAGGEVYRILDLPIAGDNPLSLPGFSRKDTKANYAHRFSIYGLEASWKDDTHTYLRFGIFCIDSLSGFGRVFTQEYRLKRSDLKDGDFMQGDKLEII